MKRKSFIALLMALVMVLAACTPGAPKNDAKEEGKGLAEGIKAEISVQTEADWKGYYEKVVERVKAKNPDAVINLIEVGSFDHLDTIDKTDASNKDVADVFALPADRIYGLVQNDVLAGIDSKKIAEAVGGWDDFDSGIGGNFKIKEEYFAFPYNIETLILFINKANAEAAGVDISKPMEVNDLEHNQALLPLFDAWFGVTATNSSKIDLLGKEDDKLKSDMTIEWSELPAEKQETIKALFEYWKANNEANAALFDKEAGWGYIDTTFTSGGKGIVRLGGPWETGSINGFTNDGKDLEVQPINNLTLAGKPLTHWQSGWGLGINSRIEEDKDKVALAEAVIAEIINPEHAVDLFKATGKILENVKVDVYKSSDLSDSDKAVISAVIESYATAPARPLFTEWGSVWDTWKNAILSWNSVKPADAEAAYKEIKASFDAMMQNF